jgi:hypothetical protein
MTSRVADASHSLETFSRTHSYADLRSAVGALVSAVNLHEFTPATFVGKRRTLVAAWAQVLRTIEQSYDPTYDPNDPANRPLLGLPDPASIRDPRERAIVQAQIAANPEKLQRAARWHDVTEIDLLAQAAIKAQLDQLRRVAPEGTDADFAALDDILRKAGLSSTRRTQIDALFYSRSAP